MSVVAVKIEDNKIIIGADSFVGYAQDSQLKDKDVKIFQHKDIIIGTVGFAGDCSLIRVFTKNHLPADNTEEAMTDFLVEFVDWCKKKYSDYKLESDFMIVFGGKVFYCSGLYIKEITSYQAMGAGKNMAQTALMLGKNVEEALNVACELSIYCEKPVNIYEVKK